jgi:hypothetical protein
MQLTDNEAACAEIKLTLSLFFFKIYWLVSRPMLYAFFLRVTTAYSPSWAQDPGFYVFSHEYETNYLKPNKNLHSYISYDSYNKQLLLS